MENCANVNGKDVCFCAKENESLHNLRGIYMRAVGFVNVKDIKCCEGSDQVCTRLSPDSACTLQIGTERKHP